MEREVLKKFIVLEGLDGSGTTTQLKRLSKELTSIGSTVYPTFEPTEGPIGKMARNILQMKISLEPKSVSKVFAADRYEHIYGKGGIIENLNEGRMVICDRYLFSSLAYQSPECGFDFVYKTNSDYPLPEHLIFLSVPVEVCQSRLDKRGETEELFDAEEFQIKVDKNYHKAMEIYSDTKMKIHLIDGTKTPTDITNEIMEIIR